MDFNYVIISGRLTRDAAITYAQNSDNMTIARFTLAVDRKGKKEEGQQTADFISCVAFGKTAEVIEKHTTKGTRIMVRGHWQTGSYKNKDGQTVYTNDCVVDEFGFAESKNASGNSDSATREPAPSAAGDEWMQVPEGLDEHLPFV